MRLCHNMPSLKLYNVYAKNIESNKATSNRIGTGLKINSAKDNPAKIGQVNQMNFQSRSLQSAQRNVQDGASMLQVADGALQEVSNILSRMKEIVVNASNGSNSQGDLDAMQEEMKQLKSNLNDISRDTEFNGVNLLGQEGEKYIMIGAMVGEDDKIQLYNTSTAPDALNLDEIDLTINQKENTKFINNVDAAIDKVNKYRGEIGAKNNIFNNLVDVHEENSMLIDSAVSRIADADLGEEILEVSRTSLLINAGIGLIAQSNRLPMDCLQILQSGRR